MLIQQLQSLLHAQLHVLQIQELDPHLLLLQQIIKFQVHLQDGFVTP